MVAQDIRLTVAEAVIALVAAAIGGVAGVPLGRYLERRGEVRCKASLRSFVGAHAVGTFYVEFFNEKGVGVALRDFRFLFYPRDPGERPIRAHARDRDTRRIMQPLTLAPKEAVRKVAVITAENPLQDDLYEALDRYGHHGLMEALATSRSAELVCSDFSDNPHRWPVELPSKERPLPETFG